MKLVLCLTLGALTALTPVLSWAQDLLTVDQAIQQALAQNPSLRAARAAVDETGARVTETRSAWFPRVSVAESWQRGNQPVFVFGSLLSSRQFTAANFAIDALNHPDPISFFQTSVGIDQLLFDGGRQRAAVRGARLQSEITRLSLDEARAQVAVSTIEAFGRVLAAEAATRAVTGALQAAQRDRARAGDRRDAGMATDADVLALDAHVADLEQRRIQHDGDAAIARASLNRVMGVPIGRSYQVADAPRAAAVSPAAADLDALLAEADANRPEVGRAIAAEGVARAGRSQARASLVPQVAAQGIVGASGTSFADRASSWIVGAEARWNLSFGGAERARLRAAAAAETRAAAEADEARAGVHVEVVTALRRLQAADARLAAGRAAVRQAQEAERIVRDRFEAGLATVTDLLRATSAVLDADAQRSSASVDALVADAQLRRALGRQP